MSLEASRGNRGALRVRARRAILAGIRSNLDGNRFHLGKQTWDLDNAELAYSNFTVGPKVTFNFSDWLHLDLYAAGAVYRRFEVFQNDDSYLRSDLSPVIGYGARFWIAPSGW